MGSLNIGSSDGGVGAQLHQHIWWDSRGSSYGIALQHALLLYEVGHIWLRESGTLRTCLGGPGFTSEETRSLGDVPTILGETRVLANWIREVACDFVGLRLVDSHLPLRWPRFSLAWT